MWKYKKQHDIHMAWFSIFRIFGFNNSIASGNYKYVLLRWVDPLVFEQDLCYREENSIWVAVGGFRDLFLDRFQRFQSVFKCENFRHSFLRPCLGAASAVIIGISWVCGADGFCTWFWWISSSTKMGSRWFVSAWWRPSLRHLMRGQPPCFVFSP